MKNLRLTALAATPLTLALILAGCATGGSSMPGMNHGDMSSAPSADASAQFNEADAMFAAMMIPHHEQAVEMSDLILAKADVDPRVEDLAQQIKAAQAPEIDLMQSWLDDWGMGDSMGDADDMHHGDGMMSADDMAALEAADGAEASRLYLEQMIVHHEGAIDMAQSELEDGVNPDALDLAQAIVDTQSAEIETMQELLSEL
ncbi:MAG: DUF305 domain-containing protein [Actinomycetota bacterium]|nr:DUF305 domain-containing protein [Actinomycetota bacterium]